MLKRLGIPVIALAAVVAFTSKPAQAGDKDKDKVKVELFLSSPSYVGPPPMPYYFIPYPFDPNYAYPPLYNMGQTYWGGRSSSSAKHDSHSSHSIKVGKADKADNGKKHHHH